ncbi:flavin reductase [Rhizobium sp. SSA_523]|uniref:flavin reductase n=1 Tax=Rhizobium sp. SSA_523 TaxID=2952477 RepID=UPI0020919CFA|nr:flavin reductase [Rhizobium sp. SSA_523]MCO5732588.1 flavin reductase [Rhizobium sp. SSA_523]WKC23773.1 flavin reductase [Rhizobium sp. SSA_523]
MLAAAVQTAIPEDEQRMAFRDAMARLGAAVTIVTTDGPGGKAGFAATAVCSVSDSPPTLLVCLNRGSSAYRPVRDNQVVCINILSADHEDLSRLFGGKTPVQERFAAAEWTRTETGCHRLEGALASFDCRIGSTADGETHEVLFCTVETIHLRKSGQALIYFDRSYRRV